MGLYGSVVAAFLGYLAVVIFRYFHTKKYVEITVEWRQFLPMLLSMAAILILQSLFVRFLTAGTLLVGVFILYSYRTLFVQAINALKVKLAALL